MVIFDKGLLSDAGTAGCGLTTVVIAPDSVNLSAAHDGQEADEVGPRVIQDDEGDDGEDA